MVAPIYLTIGSQNGFIIIPKSTHYDRMKENLGSDKLILDESDMDRIRSMPQAGRSGKIHWDAWDWKGQVLQNKELVYGKFFEKKAGFISLMLWPVFCSSSTRDCLWPAVFFL